MEPIVLWQQKWGMTFNIPWYLFLGGLAGGTLTVGALVDLLAGSRERFNTFSRAAAYVTVPVILVGGLALTFHLGKPERGFAFPLFFTNYRSWMTIGGWILGAFAPLSIAYAACWYLDVSRRLRLIVALIGVPFGVLMALYTGYLLSAAWLVPGNRWYVPLWDNRYLPVLFVLSGISTGTAAAGLLGLVLERSRGKRAAGEAQKESGAAEVASLTDAAAIVFEGAWVYFFLASLAVGTIGQQMAYQLVTRGDLAPWFWWGFVTTGLAVPLVVSLTHTITHRLFPAQARWILYVKFTLVLVGGLLLRYIVVWGGNLKSPLVFPPSMWPVPGIGG